MMSRNRGVFMVSLDFELYWGLRDHVLLDRYRHNLLGARTAVTRLLELFSRYGIHATWAAVGFLFFDGREDLLAALPSQIPKYREQRLSPYNCLQTLGSSEAADPIHFAPSLLRTIAAARDQEVGTHTFSHYYCLAEGQDVQTFDADIAAAVAAAERFGLRLRSLVFPRNQFATAYLDVCRRWGIEACRANHTFWAYRAVSQGAESQARRMLRILDSYFRIAPHTTYAVNEIVPGPPCRIPASRFLRPCSRRLRGLEPLRFRRIAHEMREAAEKGRVYHLWWHPHNFGARLEENMYFLKRLLNHYQELRDRFGMISLNMGEFAYGLRRGN